MRLFSTINVIKSTQRTFGIKLITSVLAEIITEHQSNTKTDYGGLFCFLDSFFYHNTEEFHVEGLF